jgi:hypothetical protein
MGGNLVTRSTDTDAVYAALREADPDVMDRDEIVTFIKQVASLKAWCDSLTVRATRRQRHLASDGRGEAPKDLLAREGGQSGKDARAGEERERVCTALPNFEDPEDLLTPSRLITGRPEAWYRQPLPQSLGWVDPGWFPRCVFGGGLPVFPPPASVRESELGYLPRDFLDRLNTQPLEATIDLRLLNGAPPGLVVPYLRGDEGVRISGLNPEGDLAFVLPGDRPRIMIRLRGKALESETVPHTVCVLPRFRMKRCG